MVAVIQTFGDRINFHPHIHVLMTEGNTAPEGPSILSAASTTGSSRKSSPTRSSPRISLLSKNQRHSAGSSVTPTQPTPAGPHEAEAGKPAHRMVGFDSILHDDRRFKDLLRWMNLRELE
ncbi:MAG: transposase [Candidatus Aminicenantales bacterium]